MSDIPLVDQFPLVPIVLGSLCVAIVLFFLISNEDRKNAVWFEVSGIYLAFFVGFVFLDFFDYLFGTTGLIRIAAG